MYFSNPVFFSTHSKFTLLLFDTRFVWNFKYFQPGHYNIRENATTSKTPALTSMFASKTNRIHDASSNVPGPGSYRPNEPVKDAPNKQLMPLVFFWWIVILSDKNYETLHMKSTVREVLIFFRLMQAVSKFVKVV